MRTDLEIYHDLLDAPDTGAAVMELTADEFRAVSGFLGRDYDENGISGMVLGFLLIDGHRRYVEYLEEVTAEAQGPQADAELEGGNNL